MEGGKGLSALGLSVVRFDWSSEFRVRLKNFERGFEVVKLTLGCERSPEPQALLNFLEDNACNKRLQNYA